MREKEIRWTISEGERERGRETESEGWRPIRTWATKEGWVFSLKPFARALDGRSTVDCREHGSHSERPTANLTCARGWVDATTRSVQGKASPVVLIFGNILSGFPIRTRISAIQLFSLGT